MSYSEQIFKIPMENINKIAGPFIEAWACETFGNIVGNTNG